MCRADLSRNKPHSTLNIMQTTLALMCSPIVSVHGLELIFQACVYMCVCVLFLFLLLLPTYSESYSLRSTERKNNAAAEIKTQVPIL